MTKPKTKRTPKPKPNEEARAESLVVAMADAIRHGHPVVASALLAADEGVRLLATVLVRIEGHLDRIATQLEERQP